MTRSNAITVSWAPPSRGTPTTGFMIYYEHTSRGTDTGSVIVSDVSIIISLSLLSQEEPVMFILSGLWPFLTKSLYNTVATTTSSELTGSV